MKKNFIYFITAALVFLTTACNEEPFSEGGEGNIILNTIINSDMKIVTRADQDQLSESLILWISNEKGVVRKYQSEIPSKINLVSDSYKVEAWAGDSVSASFDQKWYKGEKSFEVKKGETSNVDLTLKIANVGVVVNYDENISKVLDNPVMVVGHKVDNLTFTIDEVTENKTGYFMMPSYDPDLSFTLTGIQINGTEFSYTGKIEKAEPGTKYNLNVICNEKTNNVGGAVFSIVIDHQEFEIKDEINIVAAPKIVGYDFDISKVISAEEGMVGSKTVYIASGAKLTSVDVSSDLFDFGFLHGFKDFDLIGMKDESKINLEDEGIYFDHKYDDVKDETLFKLTFDGYFMNKLLNGNYQIKISAKDNIGNISNAAINIMISDASVITGEVDKSSISYTTAILKGTVNKNDVESVGFQYRKEGDLDWIYIEGHTLTRAFSKGDEYYAELTNLKSGSEYEYYSVSGDFESQIINKFSTLTHQQLPNAGFEEWSTTGKVQFPGLDYSSTFWDSGNHGSASVGTNITTPNSQYKHSGNYSACLKSQNFLIKFAAGNIFSGYYLNTDGTNGEVGFGRPFTDTPKKVKVWVKYIPGTNVRGSKKYIQNGMKDIGQIYVALADEAYVYNTNASSKSNFDGTEWPVVVRTKSGQYFQKDASNIVAYGEKIFNEATEGDQLIPIEFDLEYYKKDVVPSYIIFVASASMYGDYFEGCDDSTMYLDDIELIYED